jgi:hypothetical protein
MNYVSFRNYSRAIVFPVFIHHENATLAAEFALRIGLFSLTVKFVHCPLLSSCISRMFIYEMCSEAAAQLTNWVRPLFLRTTGVIVSGQDVKISMWSMQWKGIVSQYFPLICFKMVWIRNWQLRLPPFHCSEVFHENCADLNVKVSRGNAKQ